MFSNRRVGTDNGLLLACYFIPSWLSAAWSIWETPVRGLFSRPNAGPAALLGDLFHLSAIGMTRFAWLLALAKVTTVVFFALFLALSARKSWRDSGNGEEALSIALICGIVISFASMASASHAGEAEALRLHATETMMLLGGAIVVLLQPQLKPVSHALGFDASAQPVSSPSS